jgi:hypothetical protein
MEKVTAFDLIKEAPVLKVGVFGFAKSIPLKQFKAEDFSAGPYVGRVLMRHPDGGPVVLMEAMSPVPYPWCVMHRSDVQYFKAKKQALDYCRGKRYTFTDSGMPV